MSSARRLTVIVCGVCSVMTGCVNVSMMQTAETLEPGEVRAHVALGAHTSPNIERLYQGADPADDTWTLDMALAQAELGARYGLVERLDVGFKISAMGPVMVDAKLELLELDALTVSADLGVGYSPFGFYKENETQHKHSVDVLGSALVGYALSEGVSLYGAGRYIFRTGRAYDGRAMLHFVGGTGGVKLGDELGVMLEGTFMAGVNTDSFAQGNIGFFLDF